MKNANSIPLEEWPPGWLKLEVASLMGEELYLIMHDSEKRKRGYPVTGDEMRAFIRAAQRTGKKR